MTATTCQHKGCHELALTKISVTRYANDPGETYRFCAQHGNEIVTHLIEAIRPPEAPRPLRQR